MDMSDYGPEWGGNKQVLIESRNGSTFGLTLNGLKESVYNLDLYYAKGPDYGNSDIFVNGIKAGEIKGYSPHILPNGKVTMKGLKPKNNAVDIRFSVTGKDTLSKGYSVALDGISLVPERVFIPEWNILGPFPNPHKIGSPRRGLDSVYLPEKIINLRMGYHGAAKRPLNWTLLTTPENGCVSLADIVTPHELVVSYALTYIFSPDGRKTTLFFGSDDGVKVFFNGKEVYRFLGERMAEPDQAEVELAMKTGWNTLLLKIENNFGAYSFFARLPDTDSKLTVSANKVLPADQTK
jgi:hypothetical protein